MDENRRIRGPGGNTRQKYSAGRHKAKQGSAEWAKKRTRSIQRMMARNDEIPANLRNDMERELAAHKNTIADKSFQRRRSAMISKYHMVRFFERKKATRLVKQLKRNLEAATDDEERSRLQADLHIAEVDEAYTMHHPHAETYVSLYGNTKKEGDEDEDDEEGEKKTPAAKAALAAERPPMWKVVEKTMEEGPDALRQLRERRSSTGDTDASANRSRSRDIKPAPRKERMANVIAKQKNSNYSEKATGGSKVAPATAGQQQNGSKTDGLNRRERRRLIREAMASTDKEDDEGGFFEM
ncbi:nuclear protein involved in pre-rRNA processing [Cordyceps javanica]|uniref:rRNA-processing protein EFG1 n=1 Tax=Cordyceps javanica TaxID=43265 RepID=A0A545VXM1_9HYPO|nr:nuclear protein involved in pre-rRNA processing [Cordyceps javanica]TQW06468.1 nuclear protein involved in pre-rRNA processing [Cordyceps javanica]